VRSTLFYIPHEIFGIPLFGWGWAVALTLIAAVIWGVLQLRAGKNQSEIFSSGLMFLIALPLFVVVLPSVEQRWQDGTPIGLPIRGYGVMVLTGLLSGIGISSIRGQRLGIKTDTIIGLGIWMMLGGVIGARLFFVVQKWNTFPGEGMTRLLNILKLTEGGLVIYGGIFGGLAAALIYCRRNKLPILSTADLVVPAFLIGYGFGRLGCLLHGCCFGGICTADLPTIQFPSGSVPYQAQLESGKLIGLELSGKEFPTIVQSVAPQSPAEAVGIKAGDELRKIETALEEPDKNGDPAASPRMMAELTLDNSRKRIFPEQMPPRSLPVHPSQIYAAINGMLLCWLMWLWQPIPKRDGIVFCGGIVLYSISRFLVEWIRSDEQGQLGTPFTISQLISLVCGTLAVIGLVILLRRPEGRAWNWK
jgi:phosphatidylglycerol---prolipoprotein diacylglyceryl transferase